MGKRSPAFSIKIPENNFFINHMSKSYYNEVSDQLEDESFEKELDRSRREFIQFNQDLDEIAQYMKQLFEGSPHFLTGMEEIKQKQDIIEERILLMQEKIIENESLLSDFQFLQNKVHEEINNDLKMIQEQIYEILKKHQNAHTNISNICNNQAKTSEQLELMLQAIHEYARLIEEASLTIKHFADVSPRKEYESLDLSPFRSHEGSISYFEDKKYQSSRIKSSDPGSPSSPSSPTESPQSSRASNHTTITTPTSIVTDLSGQSSPLSSDSIQPNHSVSELPQYQKLLLDIDRMRRAAVGLKFLYYAHKLNDYKSNFPDNDCDLDLDLYEGDSFTDDVDDVDDVTKSYDFNKNNELGLKNLNNNINKDSGEKSKDGIGKICAYVRRRSQKRSSVVHSYELMRFNKNKRTLIKQQG
ncbi:2245_t:CDS:2 [Dentiscutata erythropus]|uniref:2245_t:CDS:1 n=1 Tax=Dentiscutata erythropus TaxID=1348616 RepID=A0A9N8WIB4_9GLOM|nr:2245_t:CDS:2 [Dentiscutata erythropus]